MFEEDVVEDVLLVIASIEYLFQSYTKSKS